MATNEAKAEVGASDGPGKGNNDESPALITQAVSAAERLEKANADFKRENDRREQLATRDILGGKTSGPQQPEAKPEISPQDYVKWVLSGRLPPQ